MRVFEADKMIDHARESFYASLADLDYGQNDVVFTTTRIDGHPDHNQVVEWLKNKGVKGGETVMIRR